MMASHLPDHKQSGEADGDTLSSAKHDAKLRLSWMIKDGRISYPTDLRQVDTIEDVVRYPGSYASIAPAESRPTLPADIINHFQQPLTATGPVFLPLDETNVLPSETRTFPIYCSRPEIAYCHPRGVVRANGKVYSESFRSLHIRDVPWQADDTDSSIEVVDAPCLYLDGEHAGHYGHTVAEIFSRLWVLQFFDFSLFNIVTSMPLHVPFIREMFDLVGLDQSKTIIIDRPKAFTNLVIPSQSHFVRYGLSSIGRDFYASLAQKAGMGPGGSRVYFSRRLQSDRKLLDEARIERMFREKGFDVIFPETLTLKSQIRVFHSADIIAGVSGSNLFGALFNTSARGKFIISSPSYLLHNDAAMNAFTRSEMALFIGQDQEDGSFLVHEGALHAALTKWIGKYN